MFSPWLALTRDPLLTGTKLCRPYVPPDPTPYVGAVGYARSAHATWGAKYLVVGLRQSLDDDNSPHGASTTIEVFARAGSFWESDAPKRREWSLAGSKFL